MWTKTAVESEGKREEKEERWKEIRGTGIYGMNGERTGPGSKTWERGQDERT